MKDNKKIVGSAAKTAGRFIIDILGGIAGTAVMICLIAGIFSYTGIGLYVNVIPKAKAATVDTAGSEIKPVVFKSTDDEISVYVIYVFSGNGYRKAGEYQLYETDPGVTDKNPDTIGINTADPRTVYFAVDEKGQKVRITANENTVTIKRGSDINVLANASVVKKASPEEKAYTGSGVGSAFNSITAR